MQRSWSVMICTVAGAASLCVCVPTPSVAQSSDPVQRPTFRSNVNLVQVDVVVVDKSGHPVRDLTKDDFELLDRGKPQGISTFSVIAHERHPEPVFPPDVSLDVGDNSSARSDRLVVLVLDDHRVDRQNTENVRELARRIINEIGPSASMGLVTTSGRVGVEVTEDRSLLLKALDRFDARETRFTGRGFTATPGIGSTPADEISGASGPALQTFFNDQDILRTMRDAAKALAPEDGRQ